MPLTRYQARNEYGLADPDLYQAADKDDPEALLEGVAMAGLVGILRQLGDLAEFAAEMFHDLHEEVMATASRSHGLMARVQQLEAEFPFVEKALLCQTDHSPFFSNKGVEWHPNLQLEQSVVTRGDLPRCVMDSYEECRGPPRLFLLDKFDISGAGACLKRYTDPSFVRHETSSYEASWDDIQREKKSQKAKRRASQWRNGGTPENALTSHAKLHELFLEEHLEARHHSDPARVVKLKTRKLDGYSLISKSGESYMGKFVQTSVDNKTGYELSTWNMDSARDVVTDVPKIISMVDAPEKSHGGSRAEVSLPNEQENAGLIEKDIETVPESTHSEFHGTTITKDAQTNLNGKPGFLQHRSYSEDLASEADNYVDAPATMESETETDDECSRPKDRSGASKDGNHHHTYSDAGEEKMQDPPEFSFLHSVGNTPVSENGQSSFGKGSTSFSYSDTASVSVDDQSDGEKFSGRLPSTCSIKSELVDSTSRATPEANIVSRDFNVQESVSSSNADGGASFSSNDTCSNPRPVSQNAESCSLTVQSLSPEIVDTSPELVRLDLTKGGSDGSEVDPVDSSKSGASSDVKISNVLSETSSISSISEGSKYDTPIDKNCMVDSQTSKLLPVVDNDVETNSTVACSKVLANSDSDTKRCDASSLTGKLVPCSTEMEMEASPDMPSKVCGPGTVDETHLEDTFDAETDCAAVPNAVADVDSQSLVAGVDSQNSVVDDDSQSSVAEIYNEHSCAFGATADVSVSESREDTLENGMSMPSEIDSKLTSDFNSGGEKLVGGASPTYNKCDEEISDIPAEFRSSDMHDEGFHDLPGLDNAATDIVPNVELAVSDNHADSSCDDVSLPSTSLTSSLPWISKNTFQSSSEAGDICPDIPAEFHSSDIHGEGFHDLPGLDNAATDNVSNVERAVSDNHADSSCDDVNDAVSLPSTSLTNSLPWISKNTAQSSSEAGEICHDTVVESDGTLPAESNPESEKIMQKIPLEVSSEGLGTALDHNDLASCGSSSPMASLDQSDRDAETKSPCKSILDDNCVDFSPVNNLNLFESVTIEELAKVQTPCASHSFTDEELKQSSVFKGLELNSPKQELNLEPSFRSFGLIPETTAPNQEDMPPLPPLPPMQWRIGKAPHSFAPTFMGESGETSSSAMSSAPPFDSSLNTQIGSKPSELAVSLGSDKSEQVPEDILNNTSENPLQSSSQFPTFGTDLNIQFGNFGSQRTQTADLPAEEPTMPNHGGIEDFGSEESNNLLADHAAQNHELVYAQDSSLQLPQDPSSKYEDFKNDTDVHVSQSSEGDYSCPETKASTRTQSTKVEDNGDSVPDTSNAETAGPSNSSVQRMVPASLGDAMWPVSAFTVAPTLDTDKPEKVPVVRLPRPRSPLVDAVAAHDRRTMKKVSERFQPPIKSKQDDKDSLLAQIRNKSVSLKPAVATRPSIQTGPKTNLRVAAILEKANTIRQAMAGSDEDEDSDSWSDS